MSLAFRLPRKFVSIPILVCLAACVSPFLYFSPEIRHHDKQRIVEALVLTVAPLSLLLQYWLRGGGVHFLFEGKAISTCLLAFFFLGILSSFNAYSTRYALYEWSSFLLLLVTGLAIALEIRTSQGLLLKLILTLCGIGCALYLIRVFLNYIGVWILGVQPNPAEFVFGFDNIRFFNHTQTISLPALALLIMMNERFGRQYWIWFATTSLWWTMLFVSGGRGTFVGVVAGVAISWIFRRKFALEWCRVMAYTFLAGATVYLLFFVFLPLLQGFSPFGSLTFNVDKIAHHLKSNPTSNRTALWGIAGRMITAHPWLGAGPLHFSHFASDSIGDAAHPHDWVLQIASEWGIPALICLVVAIGLACRSLLRTEQFIQSADHINQSILCAWLTIGAAIIIDGLVSGLIVMPVSQLWIALYIGCAWGWSNCINLIQSTVDPYEKAERKARYGLVLMLAFCVLIVLLWNGLYPELNNLPEFEAKALQSSRYLHGAFRPRIWLAGYF